MSQDNKRSVFLINKSFQIRFMIYSLLPVLLSQGLTWLALDFYFYKLIERGRISEIPEDHLYYQLISEQLELMQSIFINIGIASAILIVIWALIMSNKIAGPFYRLTRMLNEGSPDLAHIKFRPKDFFPEVADALRAYVNRQHEVPEADKSDF